MDEAAKLAAFNEMIDQATAKAKAEVESHASAIERSSLPYGHHRVGEEPLQAVCERCGRKMTSVESPFPQTLVHLDTRAVSCHHKSDF